MSKSLYSVIETLDKETGQWKIANLYSKNKDGTYGIPQMIHGNSIRLNALLGYDSFDCDNDEDEDDIDSCLYRIDELIDSCGHNRIPETASHEAKDIYDSYKIEWNNGYEYPKCVVYTLQSLELIELLAKLTSARAEVFYRVNFKQIQWLLYTVFRMGYSSDRSSVRIIIWGV